MFFFKTYREHRKFRNYKFSFVFLCFSYLSILNEPFRRGNAQIIHKIWACMGPLQNTKPSMTNIQHNLYKIEVHPIYSHQKHDTKMQNMASTKSSPSKTEVLFLTTLNPVFCRQSLGFELVAQFRLERCLHLIVL